MKQEEFSLNPSWAGDWGMAFLVTRRVTATVRLPQESLPAWCCAHRGLTPNNTHSQKVFCWLKSLFCLVSIKDFDPIQKRFITSKKIPVLVKLTHMCLCLPARCAEGGAGALESQYPGRRPGPPRHPGLTCNPWLLSLKGCCPVLSWNVLNPIKRLKGKGKMRGSLECKQVSPGHLQTRTGGKCNIWTGASVLYSTISPICRY